MLSVNRIERDLESGEPERLLKSLADNGMVMPLPIRVRLAGSGAAVLGLALRRLVELTYGPTAQSRQILARLLPMQNPDGTFPGGMDGTGRDPLATAAAVAALGRVLADHRLDDVTTAALRDAVDRGLAALTTFQTNDALLADDADRTPGDRALTTAFIVYLLGADAGFRGHLRLFDIQHWFDQHADRLDRCTRQLWDVAAVSVPAADPLRVEKLAA